MELVCPHCGAVNRVPAERLQQHPKCGKCGAEVLPAQPVELGAANFDKFIAATNCRYWSISGRRGADPASNSRRPTARWPANMSVGSVSPRSIPKPNRLAGRHAIRSIPTLALFKQGREVDRVAGALPPQQLQAWLAQAR
jgi:thioredoxin 2